MKSIKVISSIYICVLTAATPIIAQVAPQPGKSTAAPVAIPAAIMGTSINYVRTWTPSMPATAVSVVTDSTKTAALVKMSTQYTDGLGRPLQTVSKQASPSGKDLVIPIIYDNFGREQYKYLSYIQQSNNTNNGKIKSDPFTAQKAYYQNATLNPAITNEHVYYQETAFEASPLSRVLKKYAPGDSWAQTGGNHPVQFQYQTNSIADSVRIWNITTSLSGCTGTNPYIPDDGDIPVTNSIYSAGQLYKNVTINEAGYQTIAYKNKEGLLLLEKQQLSTTPGTGHAGWLCTYYVYDDLGQLRMVIPPLAVQQLMNSWNVTTVADELCYRYKYDNRNRMTMKKTPGTGIVFMVYDNRDRLVFSQDSLQRKQSKWLVNFYDGLNRPTLTALYTSSATASALQCSMNNVAANDTTGLTLAYDVPLKTDVYVDKYNFEGLFQATNSITIADGFDSGDGYEFTAEIVPAPTSGTTTTSITAINPLPNIAASDLTPLIYTYYDRYDYTGKLYFQSDDMGKLVAGDDPYYETTTTSSAMSHGMVTGKRVRVLGTDQWLTTSYYYDNKGRLIQQAKDNISGGRDVGSNLYNFKGKVLSNYVNHINNHSSVTPVTKLLTMVDFDDNDRVLSITERLNDDVTKDQTVATYTYNEAGQVKQTRLGVTGASTQLDTLSYDYNIHGWLIGINKAFVNSASTGNWFGEEVDYDNGFSVNQYNGNIAGVKWKTLSNGVPRAYGLSYDLTNRLTKADFNQQNTTGAAWTTDKVDFTVGNLTYDANGNINTMYQKGLIGSNISYIDNLTYNYKAASNKLLSVTDTAKTSTAHLVDFNDGTNTGDDYSYDYNGNLIADKNKSISTITYNYLNLPESITFDSKGTITRLYDAEGARLRETVTDNTVSPTRITTTDYMNRFLYQQDTLRYITQEEGRIRPLYDSAKGLTYAYDYFERDHMGNVRVVLGTKADSAIYAATMESAASSKENALFSNIDNTRASLPTGYPADATTNPNSYVARLNAINGQKIGPSLVLRVMAGDTIQLGVKAFYVSTAANTSSTDVSSMLTALAQAFSSSAVTDGSHAAAGNNSPIAAAFNSTSYNSLLSKDPNENLSAKPRAYLNYVLFDDLFNMVDENSGVKQVQGNPNELQTIAVNKAVIKKTGFLYIYTSNESGQDVYFDNLIVVHNTGPLLEETHYYPLGLTMAGISSSALKGNGYFANNLRYNGKELVTGNFSDGTGLGLYNFPARNYDPAIGRWLSQDWLATDHPGNSPYNFVLNNPLRFIDPFGLDTISAGGGVPIKKGDDVQIAHGEYVKASANEVIVQAKRIPTFSEQVGNTISDVWNSRFVRLHIPDVVSIGGGFGFAKFFGAGYSTEFNWILRGPEASIYPIWTTTANVIVGGASGFSINVGGATYLGPVSEIDRSIVETNFKKGGVGINVSVPLAEGISATGGYTPGTHGAPGIISGSLSFDPLAGEIGDVPVPKYGASFSNTYKVKDFKPKQNEK